MDCFENDVAQKMEFCSMADEQDEMAIVNEVRLAVDAGEMLNRLQISSSDFLDKLPGRHPCPKCGRSRKYFCYSCYVCVGGIADLIPNVKLPLKVDIIKHPREVDGKSTATHASVLAPRDVSIYTYPHFPDYEDKSKVLMIFPGKGSVTFPQLLERYCNLSPNADEGSPPHQDAPDRRCACNLTGDDGQTKSDGSCQPDGDISSKTGPCRSCGGRRAEDSIDTESESEKERRTMKARFPFERVILIDSTWNQVRGIRKDERLQGIVKLELGERESCFWRFQRGKPRTYLATIEAIYFFMVDLHAAVLADVGVPYRGQYDDLLFFFKFMYSKIHSLYQPERMRVYTFGQQRAPSAKQQRRPRATDPVNAVR